MKRVPIILKLCQHNWDKPNPGYEARFNHNQDTEVAQYNIILWTLSSTKLVACKCAVCDYIHLPNFAVQSVYCFLHFWIVVLTINEGGEGIGNSSLVQFVNFVH